jgi:hypothetical protein
MERNVPAPNLEIIVKEVQRADARMQSELSLLGSAGRREHTDSHAIQSDALHEVELTYFF